MVPNHKINWSDVYKHLINYKTTNDIKDRNVILEHIWEYIKMRCAVKCRSLSFYIDPRDLYSNIVEEIIAAIERFDVDLENSSQQQFMACIYKTIHFQLGHAIAKCRGIKKAIKQDYAKLAKVARELNIELDDQIPVHAIQQVLGVNKHRAQTILESYKQISAITNPCDIKDYKDLLKNKQPDEKIEEMWEIIRNSFSEEEIDVLERSFIDNQSVTEMLSEVNMSRSQINYLKKRVKAQLRVFLR